MPEKSNNQYSLIQVLLFYLFFVFLTQRCPKIIEFTGIVLCNLDPGLQSIFKKKNQQQSNIVSIWKASI